MDEGRIDEGRRDEAFIPPKNGRGRKRLKLRESSEFWDVDTNPGSTPAGKRDTDWMSRPLTLRKLPSTEVTVIGGGDINKQDKVKDLKSKESGTIIDFRCTSELVSTADEQMTVMSLRCLFAPQSRSRPKQWKDCTDFEQQPS